MCKRTELIKKVMVLMNCVATFFVIQTANSACAWIFHQPEFPEEAKKYSKINKKHT